LGSTWIAVGAAQAASLSDKDVHVIGKVLGFLDPVPAGGAVAVVYASGDAASKADADAIAALFGGGLAVGSGNVTAKAVDGAALGDGSGYIGIIAAAGVQGDGAMTAAKAHKIPCITSSTALVKAGQCLIAVHSDPSVDITVNHAATTAAGVSFDSAFGMLVHEI
jgi:hypothetical protein